MHERKSKKRSTHKQYVPVAKSREDERNANPRLLPGLEDSFAQLLGKLSDFLSDIRVRRTRHGLLNS